ncbi:radial spoke head protein [Thraustotheca clavata]|uniref:Radial spoke head protein n=1 Tax=Thraustotheca clavata TaxID=74557 RepID=A0A1W0A7K2_9STRA|nr:radial spoke head protein [Thraustotheca clavata]
MGLPKHRRVFSLAFGDTQGVTWMPNDQSAQCVICHEPFHIWIKRKHHCRLCGRLVCNSCSKHRAVVHGISQRTCKLCSDVLLLLQALGDARVQSNAGKPPALFFQQPNPYEEYLTIMHISRHTPKYERDQGYYIIAATWLHRWLLYVTAGGDHPGAIANHSLLSFYHGKLVPKQDLFNGVQYYEIHSDVWKVFRHYYGGGPSISVHGSSKAWNIHLRLNEVFGHCWFPMDDGLLGACDIIEERKSEILQDLIVQHPTLVDCTTRQISLLSFESNDKVIPISGVIFHIKKMHFRVRRLHERQILESIYNERLNQLEKCKEILLQNARIQEETLQNTRNYVATSLQCLFRGWKGRLIAQCVRLEHYSAISIQRIMRGHLGRLKAQRERRKQNMVLQSPWAMKKLLERSKLIRCVDNWQEWFDPWTNEFFYFEMYTQDSQWLPPYPYENFLVCDWAECTFVATTMNAIHHHKRTQHRTWPLSIKSKPSTSEEKDTTAQIDFQIQKPKAFPKRHVTTSIELLARDTEDNHHHIIDPQAIRPCDSHEFDHLMWISALKDAENAFAKSQYPSGSLYVGEFTMGIFHGWGEYYYANGDQYRGQWLNGYRHGFGTWESACGKNYRGQWQDGVKHGVGILQFPNGECYQGEWNMGIIHGRGIHSCANSDVYIGQWEKGVHHGFGTIKKANGDSYKGTFVHSQAQGIGILTVDGEVYKGEWLQDVRHGRGVCFYANGSIYSGHWVNDMCSGDGIFISPNGEKYIGNWHRNLKHGRGKYIFSNGDIFDGNFVENVASGLGVYRHVESGDVYTGSFTENRFHGHNSVYAWASGSIYEGQFVNGHIEGKGRITYYNGNRYSGSFHQAKKHGHGCFEWPNGNVYTGSFVDGQISGNGDMIYSSGHRYNGLWSNGSRHGNGIFYYANGDIYDGDWDHDVFHGKGTFTWRPGSSLQEKYQGMWCHGIRHGQGTFITIYKGDWVQGTRHGCGIYTWPNGDYYEGDFNNEEQHGQGVFQSKDGDRYEGAWEHNIRSGPGRIIYADGKLFTGSFRNGKRHGHGTMVYANGNIYKGLWIDDKRQGGGTYTFRATDQDTLQLKLDSKN